MPIELPGRIRRNPVYRSLVAAAIAGRIIGGYKLIGVRHRYGLGVPDRERAVRELHQRGARQVYDGAVHLQGLMIKIGQTLGSNPAAVPPEYVYTLSQLQDAVPPRPWRVMRPVIEQALGRPPREIFSAFHRHPVAAASLAQVYQARLHDGTKVAVKVLYPEIERLVYSDLRVLRFLLWLDSRVGGYPLEPIYQELATNVPLEVDLLHEAEAMEAMAAQFRDDPRIVIPRVYHQFSSRQVLVMEWIDGIKVTNAAAIRAAGIDVQSVADLLQDAYARQIFVHGFFHADPHPGNLFALPGDRLAIVDFGLSKRLTPEFRRSLNKLTRAMFTADLPRMLEAYDELGFRVQRGDDHRVFLATAEFFRTITDPGTYAGGASAMHDLNQEWLRAVKANPFIALPGDLTLISRVFSLLTGTGAAMGATPKALEYILKYTPTDAPWNAIEPAAD